MKMKPLADSVSVESECKGCSASVHVSKVALARLVEQTQAGEPGTFLPADAYESRIRACEACDALQFGTTCRWCGCLVAVKAKSASAKCPHPSGSCWG